MQPNIDLLIKEGVTFDRVAKLIISQPGAIQQKHSRMVYTVNALKNLGIEPNTPMFMHALRVMLQTSDPTRKKKVGVLKSLGWTEEEILKDFKHDRLILGCSEEKIRDVMDFFAGTLRLKPQTVITNSWFLHYSIDKRLRPRYNVLKTLKSKNPIDGDIRIAWLLTSLSEKKFLENFVTKYADNVPGLLDFLQCG
jgi:mTERF domain-containing protein